MGRSEVVQRWRRRLAEALDGADVPPAGGPGEQPAVDRLGLWHAGAQCPTASLVSDPARFDPDGNFVEAVFTATREVALVALRSHHAGMAPAEMVERTLEDPESLRFGVASWVAQLDRAALAALSGATVSWIVDARALGSSRGEPDWQSPRQLSHLPRGSDVTLTAPVDARRATGRGSHLLVLRPSSTPRDLRIAARVALMWALVRGEVPLSVVLGIRDSLVRVRVDIDEEVLVSALADAAADISHARSPSEAPRTPGPACRWCPLAPGCTPGQRWLEWHRANPLGVSR